MGRCEISCGVGGLRPGCGWELDKTTAANNCGLRVQEREGVSGVSTRPTTGPRLKGWEAVSDARLARCGYYMWMGLWPGQ